jgi:hypothetical protein
VSAADSFNSYQFLVLSTVITLAREPVRVAVTTSQGARGVEHFEKLAPVAVRTGRLFAGNIVAAQAPLSCSSCGG